MSNETPFFLLQNESFTHARPEDDLLHPERNAISLMRWECDGLIGHGDCQDVFWNDYLNEFVK